MPRHPKIKTRGSLDMNKVARDAQTRRDTTTVPTPRGMSDWSPSATGWAMPKRPAKSRPVQGWSGSLYVDHTVETPLHVPMRRRKQ